MITILSKGYQKKKKAKCESNQFFGKEHVQKVILIDTLIILELKVL